MLLHPIFVGTPITLQRIHQHPPKITTLHHFKSQQKSNIPEFHWTISQNPQEKSRKQAIEQIVWWSGRILWLQSRIWLVSMQLLGHHESTHQSLKILTHKQISWWIDTHDLQFLAFPVFRWYGCGILLDKCLCSIHTPKQATEKFWRGRQQFGAQIAYHLLSTAMWDTLCIYRMNAMPLSSNIQMNHLGPAFPVLARFPSRPSSGCASNPAHQPRRWMMWRQLCSHYKLH
jgi:hypothetical protein